MDELNEEAVAYAEDVDLEEALVEAWRSKYPDHIWNLDRDGVPPLEEFVTEEAKQYFIRERIFLMN